MEEQVIFFNTQEVAKHIISINGVLYFCGVIFLSAASFYFLGFKRRIKPLIRSLKLALSTIKDTTDSNSFFNDFTQIDDSLCKNQILCHIWNEFKESLILPSPTTKNSLIRKTQDSVFYFNEDSILYNKINMRLYNALPNYLTGTGILGTFIGLVAGIFLASQGLVSDDTQRMTESLQELLSGAALAFWTSIVGIVTSIVFSWREKAHTHKLNRMIHDFNIELDNRIEKIVPEQLAEKQLEQLVHQTEYLEEFTTKVAFNIAEALDNKMNEKLLPSLQKLIENVEEMRKDRGDKNDQLIEQMVDKFSDTMSGAAGVEMNALVDTINSLNSTLEPLLEKMNESQRQLQGAAAYIAEQIKTSYEKSGKEFSDGVLAAINELKTGISEAGSELNTELRSAFERAVERLDKTVSNLDGSIGKLGQAAKDTEQMSIKTNDLLKRFDDMAQKINSIQSQVNASLNSLEHTAKSIEDSGIAHTANVTASTEAMGEFKDTLTEFRSVQQTLEQIWQQYANRFENVDNSLEGIFIQIDNGLRAYSEATSEYMTKLDQQAKSVTELFGGAVQEFGDAIEDLSEKLNPGKQN